MGDNGSKVPRPPSRRATRPCAIRPVSAARDHCPLSLTRNAGRSSCTARAARASAARVTVRHAGVLRPRAALRAVPARREGSAARRRSRSRAFLGVVCRAARTHVHAVAGLRGPLRRDREAQGRRPHTRCAAARDPCTRRARVRSATLDTRVVQRAIPTAERAGELTADVRAADGVRREWKHVRTVTERMIGGARSI